MKAIIATNFAGKGYSPQAIERCESFSVDSSMDTDSDQWSIAIGDPGNDLIDCLRRDNEVRMTILATDRDISTLHSGFADEVVLTAEDGVMGISGRDLSAVAVDSIAAPARYRHIRPNEYVAKRLRALKISAKHRLATAAPFKQFITDGSETEWEAMYRFYRKRRMWLWVEPDGTFVADFLNYDDKPSYHFGSPTNSSVPDSAWIPVERAEWRKSTTSRIGDIFIFGHRGDKKVGSSGTKDVIPIGSSAHDPSIAHWIKRPTKIIESTDSHTEAALRREALEEIFESKVGAVEWKLVVANPGFIIRQNRMAVVNIPKIGLHGIFFVVGVRVGGDDGGIYMEVRLREKNYAITRRVPDDPTLREEGTTSPEKQTLTGGALMFGGAIPKPAWGPCFTEAAKKWHGPWPFELYLAVILAMCEIESHFRNIRDDSGPEWYEPNQKSPEAMLKFHKAFANSPTNPQTPGNPAVPGHPAQFAVGPMQLYDQSIKEHADAMQNPKRKPGEYFGGRWEPCINISVGAEELRAKLNESHASPSDPQNIYIGVHNYCGSGSVADSYAAAVKNLVDTKYLQIVKDAVKQGSTFNQTPAEQGQPNSFVQTIVDTARHQIGKPYCALSTECRDGSRGSFDCSGLVWYCYNKAGLSAGIGGLGTTFTYWNNGHAHGDLFPVRKADLRQADMVLFYPPDPHHMGIYIGDGKFIHAPHTGDFVKISSLGSGHYSENFVGAMRDKKCWPIG